MDIKAFVLASLAILILLLLFGTRGRVQFDAACPEATALWTPSDTSVEKIVVKWGKSPKYDIIAPIGEKPDIASSIDSVLQFMAQHSGLRVEPSQTPDLVLAVAYDIAAAAPSFRKTTEDFLQPSDRRYHAQIDAAQWEEKFRTAPRKCLGFTMFVNGTIIRAFGLIQTDAGASCANF